MRLFLQHSGSTKTVARQQTRLLTRRLDYLGQLAHLLADIAA
jgi:hypothetical protein